MQTYSISCKIRHFFTKYGVLQKSDLFRKGTYLEKNLATFDILLNVYDVQRELPALVQVFGLGI